MRCSSLLLSLLPLALAHPYSRRDGDLASDVLTQISALNTSVTALTTAVSEFDGSLLGVLPQSADVIAAEAKLDGTILKATYTAKQSINFTDSESTQIVEALANLITPINGSLVEISSKYETFKKTLEAPIVLLDLKTLKSHTDELITAVEAKVTGSFAGYLPLGQGVIDQAFNDAIAVYEGT